MDEYTPPFSLLRNLYAHAWDEGQQAQLEACVDRGITVTIPSNPYRITEENN